MREMTGEVNSQFADRPPAFPKLLELEMCSLATHSKAAAALRMVTSSLYAALKPAQRERADRFLPALCEELGWLGWSRRTVHVPPKVAKPVANDTATQPSVAA